MPALKRSGSSFAERNDVKPADLGWTPPAAAASSSKLGLDAAEAGVKSESDKTRSPSVDSKGKAKEEDIDWEAELAKEEALLSEELDQEEEILLTTYSANIVGCTSFAGAKKLKKGSEVELRRDQFNVGDPNAIVARLPGSVKIGMVASMAASRLAPLIDAQLIEIEAKAGDLPKNPTGAAAIPMKIEFWGTREVGRRSELDFAFPARERAAQAAAERKREAEKKAEEEEKALLEDVKMKDEEGDEFVWVDDGESYTPSKGSSKKAVQLDMLMAESITLEKADRPSGDMLGELFKEGAMDPSHLPTHPCPPGKKDDTMRTDLMDFQKQGLAWMINMEHPQLPKTVDDPPTQLWVMRKDTENKTFWLNVATGDSQRDKPLLKRGGILADEMGLGKTMQTIALICTDDTGEGVLEKPEEPDERFDDMTLIICPLSVASNWTVQFHHHVGSKRLKWHLYHGEGKQLTKKQLRKYDVVIATYQTVAAELDDPNRRSSSKETEPDKKKAKVDKKDDTLHQVKWRRIVLDEGHVIKNPKAKMSMAVATLKAERRWILTGTPIVNSSRDLGAMISFLRLCRPLDDRDTWLLHVGDGKMNKTETASVLRAVVSSTTLRRTKDMTDASGRLLVKLPDIKFYLHKVKLFPETRQLYDEIAGQLKDIVAGFMKAGTAGAYYSHVLVFLLRLRQLACDPSLCPQSFVEGVRARSVEASLSRALKSGPHPDRDQIQRLRGILRELQGSTDECPICGDLPNDPRITTCEHVFCAQCIEEQVEEKGCCAVCRLQLYPTDLIEGESASESASIADEAEVLERQRVEGAVATSAKTAQLIKFLQATEEGVKSLVFSQWTTHLNCIEAALTEAGISSCKFDGSMTQQKREDLIKSFSAPIKTNKKLKKGEKPPPTVMLISLKAGALGLNLTCASQVFLMDPWWQASIEAQAIDRVYRIGQTRSVRVFQLVAEDTVEDRVLDIQRKKEKLISQAFSGNKNAPKEKEKIESKLNDVAAIFGL